MQLHIDFRRLFLFLFFLVLAFIMHGNRDKERAFQPEAPHVLSIPRGPEETSVPSLAPTELHVYSPISKIHAAAENLEKPARSFKNAALSTADRAEALLPLYLAFLAFAGAGIILARFSGFWAFRNTLFHLFLFLEVLFYTGAVLTLFFFLLAKAWSGRYWGIFIIPSGVSFLSWVNDLDTTTVAQASAFLRKTACLTGELIRSLTRHEGPSKKLPKR